jgi:hypothetical protein
MVTLGRPDRLEFPFALFIEALGWRRRTFTFFPTRAISHEAGAVMAEVAIYCHREF